jgi:catechol 2,3-dioxygenase-like lactoylglutathione lyase family enzyme
VRLIFISVLLAVTAQAQVPPPPLPRVTGVSHITLYAHDMETSRAFYKDFLGLSEPSPHIFRVNDHQYIELAPEKEPNTDRLVNIGLETTGVKSFTFKDPDGHTVEMTPYKPGGFTPNSTQISQRMAHVGIIIGTLAPAMKFYGEKLGFQEIWRGSKDGKTLSWVNMKVDGGRDYLEFMLYDQFPAARLGTLHHICLEVPDIDKAKAELEKRPAVKNYTRPLAITTGINRKRQMNLYDPDGTRTEVMEPNTVDEKPTPPSSAPPPR